MDKGMSSNFVLGIFSLVYEPISQEIRKISKKNYTPFNYVPSPEPMSFSDDVSDLIKNRINFWVEDMIDVLSIDTSHISKEKNVLFLVRETEVLPYMTQVFQFFLA